MRASGRRGAPRASTGARRLPATSPPRTRRRASGPALSRTRSPGSRRSARPSLRGCILARLFRGLGKKESQHYYILLPTRILPPPRTQFTAQFRWIWPVNAGRRGADAFAAGEVADAFHRRAGCDASSGLASCGDRSRRVFIGLAITRRDSYETSTRIAEEKKKHYGNASIPKSQNTSQSEH